MDLNFQYAHHSHDESETKRNVSQIEILSAFDDFDWEGEVEKANELQKCSPTLSLIESNDVLAWVSAYGDKDNIEFVSESHFPGEVNKWFGLSKTQGIVSLDSQSFTKDQARKVLEFFASKDYESLRKLYA